MSSALTHPQISQSICHTPLNRLSQRAICSNQTLAACVFPLWHSVTFCLLSDATLHLPVSETHPYENQDPASMPPDMGYGCKMVDGVMHVYTTRNIMEKWDCVWWFTRCTHALSRSPQAWQESCLFLDSVHTFCWQQRDSCLSCYMSLTGAQSWTCPIQTCRSTSLIWTSWWPSLSTDQCKVWKQNSVCIMNFRFYFYDRIINHQTLFCVSSLNDLRTKTQKWPFQTLSKSPHLLLLFPSPQKVLLLPSSAVSQLQVPDAHPAEWDERTGGAEESPTSRLLQHP